MNSAARLPERIAPSMVAGRPVSVQSPASTRLRHALRRRGAWRPAPASRQRWRAARARSARAAAPPQSGHARDVAQIVFASSSRGVSSSRSPALIVTETRPGKAKSHSTVAVEDAKDRRQPAGGSIRKCALTMARNSVGTSRPRHQRGRGIGRHGENDGIVGGERNRLAAEIERFDALVAEARCARNWCSNRTAAPRCCRRASAGSISVATKPVARNQRPAGAAAGGERLADHRGGEPCRAARRVDVERGEQQRLDQPLDRACPRRR